MTVQLEEVAEIWADVAELADDPEALARKAGERWDHLKGGAAAARSVLDSVLERRAQTASPLF